jgi:hypothetical protein
MDYQYIRATSARPEETNQHSAADTFNGVLRDRNAQPLSGIVGMTFSLYSDQQGGPPLWNENQNVQVTEQGRFAVLLGATQGEGLPTELFSSGEPRWLGVQPQLSGEEEQPRVLLVSVPYALKAADADTIGGKPVSAFVLAQPNDNLDSADDTKPRSTNSATKTGDGPSVSAATLETTDGVALNRNWLYLAGAGDTNHAVGNVAGDGEQIRYWNFVDFFSPKVLRDSRPAAPMASNTLTSSMNGLWLSSIAVAICSFILLCTKGSVCRQWKRWHVGAPVIVSNRASLPR